VTDPHTDEILALMAEAAKLPYESLTKMELLDEAIRRADAHHEVRLGIEARLAYIRVGAALARGDAIAVAFTWCLHQYDRQPDLFAGRDLFAEYSLVIGRVANFDTVSRAQMEAMIGDFGARLVRAGEPAGREWIEWLMAAGDLGDRDLARRAAGELRRLRQQWLLRTALWFKHAVFIGDEDEALRIAEAEVLAPGRAGAFDRTWSVLPLLLLKRGRVAEARRLLRRALGQVTIHDNYYWVYGKTVAGLALAGELADALKLCGRCQRALSDHADPLSHLHFHMDMLVLFDRLHALGREAVLVRFTDAVPGKQPNGKYTVAAVRDWMRGRATDLAARFDQRNGNDYFGDQVRERADWQAWAQLEET
jgi:cellulose synthase operon protein C